jgi:tyrosinase
VDLAAIDSDFTLFLEAEAKKKKPRKGSRKWCKKRKHHRLCRKDDPIPTEPRVRRRIGVYTQEEWDILTDAFNAMKASGEYDEFIHDHFDFMPEWHRVSIFLPVHRILLLVFEDLLVDLRPAVKALPYWDWERGPGDLFTPATFGSDGDPNNGFRVLSDPFAHWIPLGVNVETGDLEPRSEPGFVRRLGQSGSLPTEAQVEAALAIPQYDTPPFNTTSQNSFRNTLEGWPNGPRLHNAVHVWGGGDNNSAASPNCPEFWLNHTNTDRIWWRHQERHGITNYQGGPGQGLNDVMPGFNRTPAQVLDIRKLGYTYE